jgi:phosphoesterase RecJ-like protein
MINEFNKIQKAVERAESVLLVGHPRPDGDCLGSMSALIDYLVFFGKNPIAVIDEEIKKDFNFLSNQNKFIVGFENIKIENYDTIFVLDSGDLKRTGILKFLNNNKPFIIEIDHHHTNMGAGDINAIKNISSTCEIIYDFFKHIEFNFGKNTATSLILGIMTDTENFLNAATNSRAIEISSKLIRAGADFNFITKKMFVEKSAKKLKFLGAVLNMINFNKKYEILTATLTKEFLKMDGSEFSEILPAFLQKAEEAKIVMVLKEGENGELRISMRSKKADVSALAKALGGGGHKSAAGFSMNGRLIRNENGGWQVE